MPTEAEIRKALAPMKNRTPVAGGDTPLVSFDRGKKKGLSTEENLSTLFGGGGGTDFAGQFEEFKAGLRKVQATAPKAAPKAALKAQSAVLGVASVPALKPPKLSVQAVSEGPKRRPTTGRRRAFEGNKRGGLSALRSKSLRERSL